MPLLRVDVQEELSHELHQLRQQLGGQGEVSVRLPHQALVTPIPSSDVGKEENSGYLTVCRTWGSGHACVKDVGKVTRRPKAKTFPTPAMHGRASPTPVDHHNDSIRNLHSKARGRTLVRKLRVRARGKTTPHTTKATTPRSRVHSRVLSVKKIPSSAPSAENEGPVPIFFPPSRRRNGDTHGQRQRKARGKFPNFPASVGALRVEEHLTAEELSLSDFSFSGSSAETILGMVLGLLTVLTLIVVLIFLIRRQRGKVAEEVDAEGTKVNFSFQERLN